MIKKTMRKEGKEDELIDWDEKIKEHRERIREEEREIEERLTKASKKNESWELMRKCRQFIQMERSGRKTNHEEGKKVRR